MKNIARGIMDMFFRKNSLSFQCNCKRVILREHFIVEDSKTVTVRLELEKQLAK